MALRKSPAALGVRVVHAPIRGYRAALMAGIGAARGTYVVMGDADCSYDFGALFPFIEKLREDEGARREALEEALVDVARPEAEGAHQGVATSVRSRKKQWDPAWEGDIRLTQCRESGGEVHPVTGLSSARRCGLREEVGVGSEWG